MYVALTKYVLLADMRPTVRKSVLRDNFVNEGSGGAIFWSVPNTMFDQIEALSGGSSGLIKLEGYKGKAADLPLAYGNKASWGGNFIASCPYALITVEGPALSDKERAPSQRTCH